VRFWSCSAPNAEPNTVLDLAGVVTSYTILESWTERKSQTELSAKQQKASGRIAAMNMVAFLLTDTGTFSDKR